MRFFGALWFVFFPFRIFCCCCIVVTVTFRCVNGRFDFLCVCLRFVLLICFVLLCFCCCLGLFLVGGGGVVCSFVCLFSLFANLCLFVLFVCLFVLFCFCFGFLVVFWGVFLFFFEGGWGDVALVPLLTLYFFLCVCGGGCVRACVRACLCVCFRFLFQR